MNIKKLATSLLLVSSACLSAGLSMSAHAAQDLKVGATPTGTPFTFLNMQTGQINGAMIDIINAIGKEAGFTPQVQPMVFSALIGSLTSKRIDLISAAMFVTPARQKVIAFSTPVYQYGEGVLVPEADKHDYRTFADMKGLVVGTQVGTTFVDAVKNSGSFQEVKLYDNGADMLSDLKAGRIQAAIFDSPIMIYNAAKGTYPGMRVVTSYIPTQIGKVAIAMNLDQPDQLARINAAIAKLQANGELTAILKKWNLPIIP